MIMDSGPQLPADKLNNVLKKYNKIVEEYT